jgi:hypothetical protein
MRKALILVFILASVIVKAQSDSLSIGNLNGKIQELYERLNKLQKENIKLKSDVRNFQSQLSSTNKSIENLSTLTNANSSAIAQTVDQLGIKITSAEHLANQRIDKVDQSLSKNSLYGIIGVLLAILLSALLYWLLSKRQKTDKHEFDGRLEKKTSLLKSDVTLEIEKTKKDLQQENIKLDLKLLEVLENQLKGKDIDEKRPEEMDHSIPLKVADEITRINAYANTLDPNSQDAKALKSSVKRLINTFKASQYEIIDLLGQKYDDGMKVTVINEVEDSKLAKEERVIVRIIKPLVKYKGEQIQAAQVDVANGI